MNGKTHNNYILVEFDPVPTVAGLVIPERYKIQDGDEDAPTAYGVNTNRKLINPQVVTVIQGNGMFLKWVSENYPEYEREQLLKTHFPIFYNKKYFVYYGAYEIATWFTEKQALIPGHTVLFAIEPIEMMPGTYLGEEVFSKGEQTASGIYITPYAEKKEGIKIKITHTPKNAAIRFFDNSTPLPSRRTINPGDTVITIDQFQYDLVYDGKKYIKLSDREIIGVETKSGVVPIGNTVMVKYVPDEDLSARIAENDRRRERRDFIAKHHLHYSPEHANNEDPELMDIEEPKFTHATLLAAGDGVTFKSCIGEFNIGDTILVVRNYGCILSDGNWIVSIDNVIGVLK